MIADLEHSPSKIVGLWCHQRSVDLVLTCVLACSWEQAGCERSLPVTPLSGAVSVGVGRWRTRRRRCAMRIWASKAKTKCWHCGDWKVTLLCWTSYVLKRSIINQIRQARLKVCLFPLLSCSFMVNQFGSFIFEPIILSCLRVLRLTRASPSTFNQSKPVSKLSAAADSL